MLPGLRDRRIRAVIAGSPSSVIWQGLAKFRNPRSSWTWRSGPLPFLPYRWSPLSGIFDYCDAALHQVARHPEAVIPVERIAAPVLPPAGEDDHLWPSARKAAWQALRRFLHRTLHGRRSQEEPGAAGRGHGAD